MTRSPTSTGLPSALVVLAAVVAGTLFAPVFGLRPLLLPVVVPSVLVFAVAVLASRRAALEPWRGVLALLAGLLGIVETSLASTTAGGLPTGATLRALGTGATESWRLTLQSTWPARPEPELMLFVPLLVVLAGVLGVELLRRWGPLPALAPSLAVLVLSQFYTAMSGVATVLAALAYAAAAGALFVATRPERASAAHRPLPALLLAAPPVVLAVVAAVVGGVVLPYGEARYTLHDEHYAPLSGSNLTNPLDLLSYQLSHPDRPVFTVSGDGARTVDRWPVVVLDGFDGVNWTPGSAYRNLGSAMAAPPGVTVRTERRTARIADTRLDGPWLPSQSSPAGADGIRPLVEEHDGTLLGRSAEGGSASYTLSWWEPQVTGKQLRAAPIDREAARNIGGVGPVPEGISELADRAVPSRPTFRSAVGLADFLRSEYRVAKGQQLPTGHSWAQLKDFLLDSKRGTSEQFAASYVALARMRGIPARLAVGYRTPATTGGDGYTVRAGNALAWPEVAVEGVGWVPLDPTGGADAATAGPPKGLAGAVEDAREALPDRPDKRDAPVAPDPVESSAGGGVGWSIPWWVLLAVPGALLLVWVAGIPLAKAVRARRRRNRPGAATVVGAWEEARDLLRGHGLPVSRGMTVRDLTSAAAARGALDGEAWEGLRSLGAAVDVALWSGAPARQESGMLAWSAVGAVRKGLRRRGLRARIRAAVNPAPLRTPR